MKEYIVRVNGRAYEVQVEEKGEARAPVQAAAQPAAAASVFQVETADWTTSSHVALSCA